MSAGALADEWQAWIAENALRGASEEDLVHGLVSAGLDAERAQVEVAGVRASPLLVAARHLLARSAGIEQVARLLRELSTPVLEVEAIDEEALHRAHWTPNRPVVLRGGARHFPAARWTLPELGARFGDVAVDVLHGREDGWWRDREALVRRSTFGALLRTSMQITGDTVYADGRCELLAEPGLAPLRAELGLLPGLVGDGFPKLWVGPAGTVTPLHHDQSTGWLVQLVGHKRVWLASPLEPALLTTAAGVFNTVDARAPRTGELVEVRFDVVDLEPGDALLVCVGWWHQVEALTPSVTVSMGGFRWPNVHTWYTPGRVL